MYGFQVVDINHSDFIKEFLNVYVYIRFAIAFSNYFYIIKLCRGVWHALGSEGADVSFDVCLISSVSPGIFICDQRIFLIYYKENINGTFASVVLFVDRFIKFRF